MPLILVSRDAEAYARQHNLWDSLNTIATIVSASGEAISSADVELVSDPESGPGQVISFTLHSAAAVEDLMRYAELLGASMVDQVAADHLPHFAINFAPPGLAPRPDALS
jgi:hypothetical protein